MQYTADDYVEAVYSDALTCVAAGETRDETFTLLLDSYPQVEADVISREMDQAAMDAPKNGVDAEDIDPSWR